MPHHLVSLCPSKLLESPRSVQYGSLFLLHVYLRVADVLSLQLLETDCLFIALSHLLGADSHGAFQRSKIAAPSPVHNFARIREIRVFTVTSQ